MTNNIREFWAPNSGNGQSVNGMGQRWNYSSKTLTTSNTLNYVRSFYKHNLTAMVGYEVEKRNLDDIDQLSNYSTHKFARLSNGQLTAMPATPTVQP